MEPFKPFAPFAPMKPMEFAEQARWWPEELGTPNSAGSQNDIHYAYFRNARRLLLRDGKEVTTYDTGDHDISGVAQASDARHARFTGSHGEVDLSALKRL